MHPKLAYKRILPPQLCHFGSFVCVKAIKLAFSHEKTAKFNYQTPSRLRWKVEKPKSPGARKSASGSRINDLLFTYRPRNDQKRGRINLLAYNQFSCIPRLGWLASLCYCCIQQMAIRICFVIANRGVKSNGDNYSDVHVLLLKAARRDSISNLTSNLSCRQTQCCFI